MKKKSYYIWLTTKQTRKLRKLMSKVGHAGNGAFLGQPFVYIGVSEDKGEPGLLRLNYFNQTEYKVLSRAIKMAIDSFDTADDLEF